MDLFPDGRSQAVATGFDFIDVRGYTQDWAWAD
jgi:hypothetical protein